MSGTPDSPAGAGGLRARLAVPVDAASVAVFRIAFGLLLTWDALRHLAIGAVGRHYAPDAFHFTFLGFGWVRPWPGDGMAWHFGALALLGLVLAAGLFTRLTAALLCVGLTHAMLVDRVNYQNHTYLVCLVAGVLAFAPTATTWSLDAWRARRAGRPPAAVTPRWALLLLRFLIACPYVFGAVAKLDDDWLSGATMTWILASHRDFPVLGRWFGEGWMIACYTGAGLAFDVLIVPAMLWRRTRTLALGAMLAFHVMNKVMFGLDIFPWFMIAATLLLLPPDWPRRAAAWWRRGRSGAPRPTEGRPGAAPGGGAEPGAGPGAAVGSSAAPLSRPAAACLAAFVGVQVLLPFRHLAYPGSVLWTKEGYDFSWHMKTRHVQARQPLFRLRDKATGEIVRPAFPMELTPRQGFRLAGDPDLVHQYCRELARRQREVTGRDVSVQAFVELSLNGRPFQALVDSEVDLGSQPRTWGHAHWIVPLTTPLFPQRPLPAGLLPDADSLGDRD